MFKKKELGADVPAQEIKDTGGDTKAKVIAQWQRDGEEIKHLVPDFDLNEAIKNKVFYEALSQGKSVFEAYKLTDKTETPEPRREIYQNGQRARRGTGGSVVNPAKMSREDFKKYIENIKSGL